MLVTASFCASSSKCLPSSAIISNLRLVHSWQAVMLSGIDRADVIWEANFDAKLASEFMRSSPLPIYILELLE